MWDRTDLDRKVRLLEGARGCWRWERGVNWLIMIGTTFHRIRSKSTLILPTWRQGDNWVLIWERHCLKGWGFVFLLSDLWQDSFKEHGDHSKINTCSICFVNSICSATCNHISLLIIFFILTGKLGVSFWSKEHRFSIEFDAFLPDIQKGMIRNRFSIEFDAMSTPAGSF